MVHASSMVERVHERRVHGRAGAIRRAVATAATVAVLSLVAGSPSATADPDDATAPAGSFARPVYVTNSANVGGVANVIRFATQPDGRLAPVDVEPAAMGARGMVITPDLRFAYVAATQSNEITMYRVGGDGALTRFGSVTTVSPFGIAIAPNGSTVYVANGAAGTVSAFAVDPVDGGLEQRGDPVSTGEAAPKEPAVTPDGRFVYVSHGSPTDTARSDVVGLAVQPDGSLAGEVGRAEAGISGAGINVTPNGRFVYVLHQASDEVVGFRIGADGSLTEVARVGGGVWLEAAGMSPDGRLLYAASLGFRPSTPDFPPDPNRPSALFGFRVGDDGSLTRVARVAMPDPIGIAFAPGGRHAYVSSYTTSTVTAFAVERSGGLTALQTLGTQGDRPAFHSTSILPNRGPAAAFSAKLRPAGRTVQFDASASADRDGQVDRYDWDFGDGTTLDDGGRTPRHTYRAPGTYRVRLTVTDDEGCSTHLVFTGQNAHCLGSGAATVTHTITVGG